jgi:WD40 repeat protein
LDEDHFLLATGAWRKLNGQSGGFTLFNAALRLFNADGTLAREYLSGHVAPLTSVVTIDFKDKRIILAGDAVGNLVLVGGGGVKIIPTGVSAPIKKIIAYKGERPEVVLIFGHSSPDQAPPQTGQKLDLPVDEQKTEIAAALDMPVDIFYLGHRPAEEIGCAIVVEYELFTCNRNVIEIRLLDPDSLAGEPQSRFTAFTLNNSPVTALALSPTSPIVAIGSRDGQIRLWSTSGILLSELSTNENGEIGALGFTRNGQQLVSSGLNSLSLWDLQELQAQLRNWGPGPDESWDLKAIQQQIWARFADQTTDAEQSFDVQHAIPELMQTNQSPAQFKAHRRFLLSIRDAKLRLFDTRSLIAHDLNLAAAKPSDASEGDGTSESETVVSMGPGADLCVLYRSNDNSHPHNGHLRAINEESGSVFADWTLPADAESSGRPVLTAHSVAGRTTCWAASGQKVFVFLPEDGSQAVGTILNSNTGQIRQLISLDNSNTFVVAASNVNGASDVILAHLDAIKDLGTTSGANAAAPRLTISVAATTKIQGSVSRVAISPDGTRVAVAIAGGQFDNTIAEVRLFDQHFNTIMSLPGSPVEFTELQFNSDGSVLRGVSSKMRYEQDLRLASRLAAARTRVEAWDEHDDRAAAYSSAAEEKDWEKGKLILRDAVTRFPVDAQLMLLLANREFYTAKNASDRKQAMQTYGRAQSLDPFDPIGYYMRGKARTLLGDHAGAAQDFSAGLELPHILPLVRVIAGFLALNEGISKLSYQLNLASKAELYLRRAAARAAVRDWKPVVDDVHWLRHNGQLSTLASELEASAFDNLGDTAAAVASYKLAATTLKDTKNFGLDEFSGYTKLEAWRNLKLAVYERRIGDVLATTGRSEEAAAAHALARELIEKSYAAADLTSPIRAWLDQVSDKSPSERCANADSYKSFDSKQPAQTTFVNNRESYVRIYWLDYKGERNLFATLGPGQSYTPGTYLSHPWLVTGLTDECIGVYVPELWQSVFDVN